MFRRQKKPTANQQPASGITYCAYSCESCGTQLAMQLKDGNINELRGTVTCSSAELHLMMHSLGIIDDTQAREILDNVIGSTMAGEDASKMFDHLPMLDIRSVIEMADENEDKDMHEWMKLHKVPEELWPTMLDIKNKPESIGLSYDDASSSPNLELIAKCTRLRALAAEESRYEATNATATLVAEHASGNLYEVLLGDKLLGVYRPHVSDEPNLRQQHTNWVNKLSDDLARFGFGDAEQSVIKQQLLDIAEYDNTSLVRLPMKDAKDGLEELAASIAQEKNGLPYVESKILLENNRSKAVVIKTGLNPSDIIATLILILDSQFTQVPQHSVRLVEISSGRGFRGFLEGLLG